MARWLVVFSVVAILVLIANVSCKKDDKKDDKNDDKKSDKNDSGNMRPCSPSAFVRLDECCDMPKLVTTETFKKCLKKAGVESTNKTKNGGLSHAYKSYGGVRGGPGGPMCLVQCLLKEEGLLMDNGEANQEKIKSKLLANSTDKWKPIVTAAIKNCSEELAKVNTSAMTSTAKDGSICKAGPALFNSAVRRLLAMNCITPIKSNITDCDKKLKNVRDCDPWGMKNGEFPMLRAYRLKTGAGRNGNSNKGR